MINSILKFNTKKPSNNKIAIMLLDIGSTRLNTPSRCKCCPQCTPDMKDAMISAYNDKISCIDPNMGTCGIPNIKNPAQNIKGIAPA